MEKALRSLDPSQNVSINIVPGSTGDSVVVEYMTPNSNNPNRFGNQLYLWQAEGTIPWGEPALQHQGIDGQTRQGSVVFTNLTIGKKGYIVGYGVGADTPSWVKYGNVCATASWPAPSDLSNSQEISYFSSKISPQISSDSINVGYQFTPGVQPKTNGAWLALWEGKTNPYLNPNYLSAQAIASDGDNGTLALGKLVLVTGHTYTLALMMSGWAESPQKRCQTTIAAVSTFSID